MFCYCSLYERFFQKFVGVSALKVNCRDSWTNAYFSWDGRWSSKNLHYGANYFSTNLIILDMAIVDAVLPADYDKYVASGLQGITVWQVFGCSKKMTLFMPFESYDDPTSVSKS